MCLLKKNGIVSTPPLNAGILPGVYRKHLLKNDTGIKENLYLEDLKEADKIVFNKFCSTRSCM